MKMIKDKLIWLIITVWIAVFFVGCQSIEKASKVAVSAAELTVAVSSIKREYIEARGAAITNKAVFTDDEWLRLQRGNDLLVELDNYIQQLKIANGGASEILLNTAQLAQIAQPVQVAANDMISVMDSRISAFDADVQQDYADLVSDVR